MADPTVLPLQNALRGRNEFDILVVGRNGHGRSSLINRLCGHEVANVQRGLYPQRHDFIETHQIQIGSTQVHFHDTRGFPDPEIPNYIQVLNDIYERKQCFDVVLICQKLYDPVDATTLQGLTELRNFLGDDLIAKSIVVCTFGDQYIVHDAYRDGGSGDANVIEEMTNRSRGVQRNIVKCLCPNSSSFNDIPVCIASGVKDDLPTPPNWKGRLCELIERKSRGDPKPFVNWYKRKSSTFVVVGAAGGAIIGAGIGSVVPGIGTAIGAGVGAVIGLFGGGSAGGIASVTGERLTQPTRHS